jgi:threonine dehydratase
MASPISRDDIRAAHERIAPHVRRTPVWTLPHGFGHDGPVSLKLEFLQHAGSFKPRGAFNTLLSRPIPDAGVAAASGGNHGAAVAYAARQLGAKARIFVPEIAAPAKVAVIRAHGAEVVIGGARYADAQEACDLYVAETGALRVHPFDADTTIAGQGTVALEWEEDAVLDTALVAVGGGGLVAGMATWWAGLVKVSGLSPRARGRSTRRSRPAARSTCRSSRSRPTRSAPATSARSCTASAATPSTTWRSSPTTPSGRLKARSGATGASRRSPAARRRSRR